MVTAGGASSFGTVVPVRRPKKRSNHEHLSNLRMLPGVVQQSDRRVVHCLRWASCTHPAGLNVGGVDLTVNESQGPWLVAPSGLWQASGWVRDRGSSSFYGDSPSGVCGLSASINGQAVTLGPGAAVGRNSSTWHQCAGASASPTIQTADYGQGPMPLTIAGCDAAGRLHRGRVHEDDRRRQQPAVGVAASPGRRACHGWRRST